VWRDRWGKLKEKGVGKPRKRIWKERMISQKGERGVQISESKPFGEKTHSLKKESGGRL